MENVLLQGHHPLGRAELAQEEGTFGDGGLPVALQRDRPHPSSSKKTLPILFSISYPDACDPGRLDSHQRLRICRPLRDKPTSTWDKSYESTLEARMVEVASLS